MVSSDEHSHLGGSPGVPVRRKDDGSELEALALLQTVRPEEKKNAADDRKRITASHRLLAKLLGCIEVLR